MGTNENGQVASREVRSSATEAQWKTSLPGWSFGLGLISIILADFLIFPVAAIPLGAVGLRRISEGATGARWMAWTGIVLGTLYTIVGLRDWGFFG